MPRAEQSAIARLLAEMDAEQILLTPPLLASIKVAEHDALRSRIAGEVWRVTGLQPGGAIYSGWIGFECSTVVEAVATMRLVVVSNVLVRREGTVLYLPLNPRLDANGATATEAIRKARQFLVG